VQKLAHKVGGLFQILQSHARSEITLNQNEFFPGEQIKVFIKCDNSKSSVAVKSFKFKFFQTTAYEHEGRTIETTE
jgi:hypothetical protein